MRAALASWSGSRHALRSCASFLSTYLRSAIGGSVLVIASNPLDTVLQPHYNLDATRGALAAWLPGKGLLSTDDEVHGGVHHMCARRNILRDLV